MATLAVTNDFSAGAAIVASEMNTNFSDVETFINSTPGVLQLTGGTVTGAVTLSNTLTVGADDTGYDVKLFGATTGKSWLWDEDADKMIVTGTTTLAGATQQTGTLTVGVDDTGHDVKFFGATTGKYMLWDESADRLDATGDIRAQAASTWPVVIGVGNPSASPNGANIAIGTEALSAVTSNDNVAIGIYALRLATTSGSNIAIGSNALASTTTQSGAPGYAQYNVAIGHEALFGYVHGSGSSVAVGFRAGKGATTGTSNTFIGMQAAQGASTGSNNTCLGFNAAPLASDTDNSITFGDSNIATLRCQVTSISALSDERDKTDIEDLDMGLAFIQRLRPVRFVWNMRDEDGKHGIVETGFIAQELQQAQADEGKTIPNLTSDENPDRLEAAPGTLLPALVRAIQELDDKVEALA